MRQNYLLIVLALVVLVRASPTLDKMYYDLRDGPILFEQFMRDYKRTYKDETDTKVHYEAFLKNLKKINELNAAKTGAVFGINKFTDYTEEELKKIFGFKKPTSWSATGTFELLLKTDIPF